VSADIELRQFATTDWTLRTTTDAEGEAWFVAADVTNALGYTNGREALNRHVPASDRGVVRIGTPGGPQTMVTVNESGIFSLILGSRLPAALAYRKWVTSEVLPSIHRTGSYVTPTTMPTHSQALRGWADAVDRADAAEARAAELAPAAAVTQRLIDSTGDYSLRETAQILCRDQSIETGQNRLLGTLVDIGWVDRHGKLPYQATVNAGRMVVRTSTYDHPTQGPIARTQLRITPKGLADLHRLLATGDQLELVSS
jgi:anti-repressor protein